MSYTGSLASLRLPAGPSLASSFPPPPCFLSSPSSSSSLPLPAPTTLSPHPCSHSEPPPGLPFLEASSFTGPVFIPGCSTPKRSSLSSLGSGGVPGGLFIQWVESLFQSRAGGLPCREAWSPPSPHAWPVLQPLIHCRRMRDSLPTSSCTIGFAALSWS